MEELSALQARIGAVADQFRSAEDAIRPLAERLEAAIIRVTESWTGSFAGYHTLLYFRDFERPSWHEAYSVEWGGLDQQADGWRERTPEEVKQAIEAFGDAKISSVEKESKPISQALDVLRDDLAVALAPIRQLPALATEMRMLDELEKMPLRVQLHEYLNANMGGIQTRDSRAAMQGIRIPAHLYYEAQLAQATTVFQKGTVFLRAADRLVRQVRSQQNFIAVRTSGPTESIARVVQLCERFHGVVARLRTRRDGRPPLEVNDEYDVQDLLGALLQTDFDDVRREERSPSHAGSSPALDFLLKAEQLGIEVKMTRPSMSAKTLGDELLADVGRYAEHPDCRTLVCFVYDPDCRLKNPRGLERDLEKHSREGLRVVVIIAPR